MLDPRITALAKNLVNYSVSLQKGEKLYIEAYDIDAPLVKELVKEAFRVGAYPFVAKFDQQVQRELLLGGGKELFELMAKYATYKMADMDAYIGVRGSQNSMELSDVPSKNTQDFVTYYQQPVHSNIRVTKTKWVILRYPTPSFAQLSGMSTDEFENFFFNVCNLDYRKMDHAMTPLCELLDATYKVRIIAKNTDISFSIKGIPAVKCKGDRNIPDGEVYTAPVKDSVNGRITYNAPSIHNGLKHENVSLLFKDGKIIEATSNHQQAIDKVFDTDEGARYIGEFAIGVNPYITKPVGDILFDEKISGSIHFTPGNCYDEAYNGNKSAIHWDLVLIQTPEFGGGEIWFDDVLVRKDGIFVHPALLGLNPENLK